MDGQNSLPHPDPERIQSSSAQDQGLLQLRRPWSSELECTGRMAQSQKSRKFQLQRLVVPQPLAPPSSLGEGYIDLRTSWWLSTTQSRSCGGLSPRDAARPKVSKYRFNLPPLTAKFVLLSDTLIVIGLLSSRLQRHATQLYATTTILEVALPISALLPAGELS